MIYFSITMCTLPIPGEKDIGAQESHEEAMMRWSRCGGEWELFTDKLWD